MDEDTSAYVHNLEEKLKSLGCSEVELAALKSQPSATTVGEAAPVTPTDVKIETRFKRLRERVQSKLFTLPVSVRLRDVDLRATVAAAGIENVLTANPVGALASKGAAALRGGGAPLAEKRILREVTHVFEAGSLTLVLGPPASGKTSLLKAIAGQLRPGGATFAHAELSYNGDAVYPGAGEPRRMVPHKVAAYVDQIDRHSPNLTVEETFLFAFHTYGAGRLMNYDGTPRWKTKGGDDGEPLVARDDAMRKVDFVLDALGIDHVRHTVVGDAETRGVSGGQRRRVTVGEMLMGTPRVICGDEISTGLDARTTRVRAASPFFSSSSREAVAVDDLV